MKLLVLLLFTVLCVGCRSDEVSEDECSPITDDLTCGVVCTLIELRKSTKCYFGKAFEDAADSARVISGLVSDSGKKALKYMGVQLLIPLMYKDTNALYGRIDLSDQFPQTLGLIVDVSQISDTLRVTGDFLKLREAEGTLPQVNIGNLLWSLKKMASYHGSQFFEWAEKFAGAVYAVTRDPANRFNFRHFVDEVIRNVPDHIVELSRDEVSKYSREQRQLRSDLDRYNRKALELLKVLTCRLFFENGLPALCEDAVTMWDGIEQAFISSQNQRSARSVPLVPITESIFGDLGNFPFHLYLEPIVQKSSESDKMIVSLKLKPVLKDIDGETVASARSHGSEGMIDLVSVLDTCTDLLSYLRDQITEIADVAASSLDSVAKLKEVTIPPPQTPAKDVFTSYSRNKTSDGESFRTKRSVNDFIDEFKVVMGCVNTEWLRETASSGIFPDYLDISSQNFQKILEGNITENIGNLKQAEKKEAFVEAAVSHIVDHINSGRENLKLGRTVQEFLVCIESNYGPLQLIPLISGVAGKTNVKEYTVKILDEWDYHLSQMVNIFKVMDAERRIEFVKTNVEDCLRVILYVWKAFQLTRANSMCFTSHICHFSSRDLEKPSWRPELVQIVGLLVEFIRGVQDNDWDNFPYVLEVFLNPSEACETIPAQACVEGSIYRLLYTTLEKMLPDSVMSLLIAQ